MLRNRGRREHSKEGVNRSVLVLLRGLLGFGVALLFLEEFLEPVDETAASADHVQTALLLMLLENLVQTLFEIGHGFTSYMWFQLLD